MKSDTLLLLLLLFFFFWIIYKIKLYQMNEYFEITYENEQEPAKPYNK